MRDDYESERRDAIVALARSKVGEQNPDDFWSIVCPQLCGRPTSISWCGGFALWCLRESGVCRWPGGEPWKWAVGIGFAARLPQTTRPEPGDIAYIAAPYQHHAIVDRVETTGLERTFIHTIDGNVMPAPKEGVELRRRPLGAFTTFFSIAPLVGYDSTDSVFPDREAPTVKTEPPPNNS